MKPRMVARFALLLCLFCSVALAAEKEEPAEVLLQTDRYHVTYTVNADGSFIENREVAFKVLKKAALTYAKDSSISYSTSIQKAEVLQAYTLKADGRRIDVPQSNFQITANTGKTESSPVYSDRTTLTVVFPELEVGDSTVFSYRLTANQPMFDKHFSIIDSFSPFQYYDDVRISIDVPDAMWVRHEAWQLKEVRNEHKDGRRIVEWTWRNTHPLKDKREDYSVFEAEQFPGYAFSTFRNYADIAGAYGLQATPKAAVTPRIQKLADELTVGKTEPRDISQALYEWVSAQISYAGNCIGLGAVVPRDTDFILDNRMGDCKDHATLLQALLKAKGIISTQALVNAGSSYQLPKIPVASVVNHVITYIPALDLYADSTAATVPFGLLPLSVVGKPVLLVDGHRDDAKTPPAPSGRNAQRMKTVLKIEPDGSVQGTVKVSLDGEFAVQVRDSFRDQPDQSFDEFVKQYFRRAGYRATGTFTKDDPKPLLDKYTYSSQFRIEELLAVPGGFVVSPVFFNVSPIASHVSDMADEAQPAVETACVGSRSEEEYAYQFPEALKVVAIPSNLSIQEDLYSYTATYALKGNILEVRRVFDNRAPGPVCSAEAGAAYQEFVRNVQPNLKAQVVFLPR